jgi:hypothetical protein
VSGRAALYNGCLVRYLDFMDGYLRPEEVNHPCGNIMAILAFPLSNITDRKIRWRDSLAKELIPSVERAREVFRSLECSPNVIMHSGQLKLADVERVAMNIRDWVQPVGG